MQDKQSPKKSKYEALYKPAQKYITVNDGDTELTPITLRLPSPPDIRYIDGYGLPPEEQKFNYPDEPARLKILATNCLGKSISGRKPEGNMIGYAQQKVFWATLNDEQESYKEEIEYIRKTLWYLFYGYWCFICGKPTWIPPKHFFYLKFYYAKAVSKNKISYREEDRLVKIFEHYCDTTTETFKNVDSKGNAIPDEYGRYEMIDAGHRTCVGSIQPKRRRKGVSMQNCADGIYTLITGRERKCVIQADTGQSSEDIYNDSALLAWVNLPIWLKPIYNGEQNPTVITLKPPDSIIGERYLGGELFANDAAKEGVNDRRKIHFLLNDESGKCFGRGTMVKMGNGDVKAIEDVSVGDYVMGINGPDEVVAVNNGIGNLYEVIPNKSDSWVCDENHILHCSVSDRRYDDKLGAVDGVINVVLKDYLTMPYYVKKSIALYHNPVTYPSKKVKIPPYFLGYWLGDGTSAGLYFTTIEPEVIDYANTMCSNYGMSMRVDKRGITYGIKTYCVNKGVDYYSEGNLVKSFDSINAAARYFGRTGSFIKWYASHPTNERHFVIHHRRRNMFLKDFKGLGVINNKHIPRDYLYNDRNVRLELLAGLIDSDGYVDPNKGGFEICCVLKDMAYQIVDLCRGLGYYVKIAHRKTSAHMGDYHFNGFVYRIAVYGSFGDIPSLVPRKRDSLHTIRNKNRNPLKDGFCVKSIGEGSFFGITLKNNPLFLLADHTVVHNCSLYDVEKRFEIDRLTLLQGTDVHGTMRNPSTVEEMLKGGSAFLKLFNRSNFYNRDLNGFTQTGLFRLFRPVWQGWDGYFDEWGQSVITTPTEAQLKNPPEKSDYPTNKMGSKDYWQKKYSDMLADPTKHGQYRLEIRKHPMRSSDAWIGSAGDMAFPYVLMDQRISELRLQNNCITGNFVRKGDQSFWVPCDDGRFIVSNLFIGQQNQWSYGMDVWDEKKQRHVPAKRPRYTTKFTCGADPFTYGNADGGKKAEFRVSDGGIAILWNQEPDEVGKDMTSIKSYKLICTYKNRPPSLDAYCEDVLAVCLYYGAMLCFERNKERLWEYFVDNGYGGYLLYLADPNGVIKDKPGVYAQTASKDALFQCIRDYLQVRCHVEDHAEFLDDAREIRNPNQLSRFDRLAAVGWSLYGSKNSNYVMAVQRIDSDMDLSDWYEGEKEY